MHFPGSTQVTQGERVFKTRRRRRGVNAFEEGLPKEGAVLLIKDEQQNSSGPDQPFKGNERLKRDTVYSSQNN